MDVFILVKGLKTSVCLLGGSFQRWEWGEGRAEGGKPLLVLFLSLIPKHVKRGQLAQHRLPALAGPYPNLGSSAEDHSAALLLLWPTAVLFGMLNHQHGLELTRTEPGAAPWGPKLGNLEWRGLGGEGVSGKQLITSPTRHTAYFHNCCGHSEAYWLNVSPACLYCSSEGRLR